MYYGVLAIYENVLTEALVEREEDVTLDDTGETLITYRLADTEGTRKRYAMRVAPFHERFRAISRQEYERRVHEAVQKAQGIFTLGNVDPLTSAPWQTPKDGEIAPIPKERVSIDFQNKAEYLGRLPKRPRIEDD